MIMRLLGEDVTDQVQAADDRDTELTATDRAAQVDRPVAPMPHWRTPDGELLRDLYNATYSAAGTGE